MKEGIHFGIPMAGYLLLDALSSGVCHTLLSYSPQHAKHQQTAPSDPSDASDMGTAIHSALLEGIDIIESVDAKDWRTNAAKEARELAYAAGKIPILAHKVEAVNRAVRAARVYLESSPLAGILDNGHPEVTMVWQEGDTLCKARPDWLTDDGLTMLHVKTTTGSANPQAWIRAQLAASGYDVSWAFYQRGAQALGMTPDAYFLVIEQNAPYGCSLVGMSAAMADIADRKVTRALKLWAECQQNGAWPAYPSDITYAEPLPWQLAEAEEMAALDNSEGFVL